MILGKWILLTPTLGRVRRHRTTGCAVVPWRPTVQYCPHKRALSTALVPHRQATALHGRWLVACEAAPAGRHRLPTVSAGTPFTCDETSDTGPFGGLIKIECTNKRVTLEFPHDCPECSPDVVLRRIVWLVVEVVFDSFAQLVILIP